MQQKHQHIHKYWYGDEAPDTTPVSVEGFDYHQVDSLAKFVGTHPEVMLKRIKLQNWQFTHDISRKNLSLKYRLKMWFIQLTGFHIGEYRNYKLK